jgi:hypothetical protein
MFRGASFLQINAIVKEGARAVGQYGSKKAFSRQTIAYSFDTVNLIRMDS